MELGDSIVMCRRLPGVGAPVVIDPNTRRRHRPAAYVVCRSDGAVVLLCRLTGPALNQGWFTLPGGGIDPGESPIEAAARELTEETGYSGVVGDELTALSTDIRWLADDGVAEVLVYEQSVFAATITGGELAHEFEGSTNLAAWISFDRLHEVARMPVPCRGLAASLRSSGEPAALEVVQLHLAAVKLRDRALMAADYVPDARLIRGDETYDGLPAIASYFDNCAPSRLGVGWVEFTSVETVVADSVKVGWRISAGPGHGSAGEDTFVVSEGRIAHQVVALTTPDF